MGLHYSERRYYENDKENDDFIKYYAHQLYCKHGQANYVICYKCKEECAWKWTRNYWREKNIKYRNFNWNAFFGMESPTDDDGIDVDDDYRVLGLKKTSSQEDLKKAFHKKARETHPDKVGGDGVMFKRIRAAYDNIKHRLVDLVV